MAAEKGISVIISTYSTKFKDQVLSCINSLKKQILTPNEILLILDNDHELVSFYKQIVPAEVKIVESDGFGLSYARNTGVKHASSEIVAFIDDDAIADKNWLSNLLNNYSEPSVVGVGGLVLPLFQSNKSFKWFPEELNWVIVCSYKGGSIVREPIRNPIGCNMSFRRSIFDEVGYFRKDVGRLGKVLLDGEEPEFAMRIICKKPDAQIMNEPAAIVFHKVNPKRMTFNYLCKRSFYQGFSKALISGTYGETSKALSMERDYLKYLLTNSVKSRTAQLNLKNLGQLVTLLISTALVFAGFAIGKISKAVD